MNHSKQLNQQLFKNFPQNWLVHTGFRPKQLSGNLGLYHAAAWNSSPLNMVK
jgi:hypothetical protein